MKAAHLVLHVNVAGGEEGVDAREAGPLQKHTTFRFEISKRIA